MKTDKGYSQRLGRGRHVIWTLMGLWVFLVAGAASALAQPYPYKIDLDPSTVSNPDELTDLNGKLYFIAYDSGSGLRKLWVSDGGPVGFGTNIVPGSPTFTARG